MATINSSSFNFAETVRKFLDDYDNDVYAEVSEAIVEVAKEAAQKLKKASRATFRGKEYAKGWTHTVEKGRLKVAAIVYGKKPTYALAHLLEFGHVTRNGTGRTFPRTPAHEHIAPINDWAQDEAVNRAVSKLEKRI